MQGNFEEGDLTILLNNWSDNIPHVAIDFGVSLIKLVYFSRHADHSNNVQGKRSIKEGLGISSGNRSYPILGGQLHFVKFKIKNLNECLDLVSSKQLHRRGIDLNNWHLSDGNTIIKAAGGGAYKYAELFKERLGVSLDKEDGMDRLVAGANFLLKAICDEAFTHMEGQKEFVQIDINDLFPYLLVNIDSGVSMIKVDGDGSFQRVSWTHIGGGTHCGLGGLLTTCKRDDNRAVDMLFGDIYGGLDYSKIGLPASTIASSFGKATYEDKELSDYRREDLALSLLQTVAYNIARISYLNASYYGIKRIYFGGFFTRDHAYIMDKISYEIYSWSKGQAQAIFMRHEGFLGALGAFMSYKKGGPDDLMAHHLVEQFPMGAPGMGGMIHGPPHGDLNEKISWMEKFVQKGTEITALVPMCLPGTTGVGGFEQPFSKGDTLRSDASAASNVVLHIEPILELFPLLADIKMMSSSNGNSCEWAPKCLYGNGDMILFTSHMQSNPNQKFWRCSNWNNENGCVPFLWKDRASTERISETNSTPMERDDGKEELQGLTVLMEDLKKAIELQNIYLRASIEEKREMNKLSDLQNLYLRKIYRTMIFMSRIICVALAFLSNQTRKLM